MLSLCQAVLTTEEQEKLERLLSVPGCVMICGLSPAHRALLVARIQTAFYRPVAVLTADERDAASFAADLSVLTNQEAAVLPNRELTLYNIAGQSHEWEHKRIDVLHRLSAGTLGAVCGSVEAFTLRTVPKETLVHSALTLSQGDAVSPEDVTGKLTDLGYVRAECVEGVGQFALRGGILDVFSPAYPRPVRMEFFGDEIDSMGLFDPASQRRTENIRRCEIVLARELPPALAEGGRAGFAQRIAALPKGLNRSKLSPELLELYRKDSEAIEQGVAFHGVDLYLSQYSTQAATALDYLPENTVVFVDDFRRVAEEAQGLERRNQELFTKLMEEKRICGRQTGMYLDVNGLYAYLKTMPCGLLGQFMARSDELPPREIIHLTGKQLPSLAQNFETLCDDARHYVEAGFAVVILAATRERIAGLDAMLREQGLKPMQDLSATEPLQQGRITLTPGGLSAGLELTQARVAILNDIRPTAERRPRRSQVKLEKGKRQRLQTFSDLREGDLVVHDIHGIGRFQSIVQLEVDGIARDFIKIAYAGSDVLYIPVTQLETVSKYLGAAEDTAVRLSKLGGTEWAKTRSRAKGAAKELAKQLIALYARRMHRPGFAFSRDGEWQREFEESFPYEETVDQLTATAEIKQDMERAAPMDRLLCGDVGFGKTEVALRAAMKCILDSKQVALLVPTTVLARQHMMTVTARFGGYPVKVAMLSRFTTATQVGKILRGLKNGSIDMVVGTHRLLGKQVVFHDLGLIIVDEEQRFGVAHKERLKEISGNADVLTLSATPIPRTLNMALSGVRDMSVLEESPRDRYPVTTYVSEYNPVMIRDAIARELARKSDRSHVAP